MKKRYILVSFCLLAGFFFTSKAQPGMLDPSFGTGGISTGPVSDDGESGYAAALQTDGKILVGGFQEVAGTQNFAVARFNTDGSLDNGFGSGGLAIFNGGTDSDAAWAMAIQNDGKILLGGSVYNQMTTFDDYALVRLNTDGSADNSFGTNGIVTTDIDGYWDNAYDMTVQVDGKIILVGDGYSNNKRNMCLTRYNTDGSLDATFGNGGIVIHTLGSNDDNAEAIALQSDGKILVSGYLNNGMDNQAFVARLNTDGSLDNTFSNNGIATLDIGAYDDRYLAISVLPDGRILAGGSTINPSTDESDYVLVCHLTDGTLDLDFGSNGIALTNVTQSDYLNGIAIADDGKIYAAGGGFSFELLRFLESGYLDPGFGTNGVVNTTIGTFCFSYNILLQSDEKAILAGQTMNGDHYDFALARYLTADGSFIDDNASLFKQIHVFPNPASSMLYCDLPNNIGQSELFLYDLFGRKISAIQIQAGQKQAKLDVSTYPDGVYFVVVRSDGKVLGQGKVFVR